MKSGMRPDRSRCTSSAKLRCRTVSRPTGYRGAKNSGKMAGVCAWRMASGNRRRHSRQQTLGATMMQMRVFGRTGMQLSVLGFGCGAVGGIMVRGDAADQERLVARALDVGVNYFDTAVLYGDGESEKNLGRVLRKLKPANAIVG